VTRTEPGGERRDRVDLDADDTLGEVSQDLEGLPVRYDERSLTDENVLCFAAYSPLLQGTAEERRDRLGIAQCTGPDLDHTFPAQVTTGATNTLTITASALRIADAAGDPLPLEDVYLELEQSDGVILGAASGRTNADGVFTTSVTVPDGETGMSIGVTAYDDPGGEELASDSVSAQVDLPGVASIDGVQGEITYLDGEEGNNEFVDSGGAWSLSGGAGGTSVSASASVDTDGDVVTYSGSGTIDASGGVGLIGSYVAITVTGGPVRWVLTQRIEGTWPIGSLAAGCYINQQFVANRGGSRGGILEPGEHEISHNCGGGGEIDAEMEWTLTLGE
jgi:hypothetical protein